MTRIVIPRSSKKLQQSGCWWDTGARIVVKCPQCDKIAGLNHEIDANGNVNPSLECPNEDCTFHRFIQLLDWA